MVSTIFCVILANYLVMTDYQELGLPVLVDLLAEQTSIYTKMMTDGFKNGDEFSHIEQRILNLQKAINAKHDFTDNETSTGEVKFE
jgi:hypothetical protein